MSGSKVKGQKSFFRIFQFSDLGIGKMGFWSRKNIFFSIFVFWAQQSKKLVCTSDIGASSWEWRSRATSTTDCEAHPMLDCKINLEDIIKIFSAKQPHDDILYMNNVWLESLVKNHLVKKPCANHQMSAACIYVCWENLSAYMDSAGNIEDIVCLLLENLEYNQ